MTLLVDVGNSRIKWSSAGGDAPGVIAGADYDGGDFTSFADAAWRLLPPPERVVVCNVRGEETAHALSGWAQRVWHVTPEFVRAQARAHGIENAYSDPAQLGADRWAALVGARHLFARDVCVVDCGTALTVDGLTRDGVHIGGMIAPGVRLMRDALSRGTRRVPATPPAGDTDPVFGNDTASCVRQGTLNAAVAFVERAWFAMSALRGDTGTECIITGGDAPLIVPFLTIPYRHQPDLVMHGLLRIAGAPS